MSYTRYMFCLICVVSSLSCIGCNGSSGKDGQPNKVYVHDAVMEKNALRLIPYSIAGQQVGFRIIAMKEDGALAEKGVQLADTVTAVNSVSVQQIGDSQHVAAALVNSLKDNQAISVLRMRETVTIGGQKS